MSPAPAGSGRSRHGLLALAAGVALAGAAETAWLVLSWLRHGHLPCAARSRLSCEALFLASGTMPLGVPLAAWGHAAYACATLLALAALWLEGGWAARARAAFRALALAMALFSLFLLARMAALGALCPWCLLSAAFSLSLGAIAVVDDARDAGLARAGAAGAGLAGAMVALTVLAGGHKPIAPHGEPRELESLARHLAASGARFYGVWWCDGCREQKEMFGVAALELPYVECSAGAPAGVTEYPTWEIAGRRTTGVLEPDSLAVLSGFGRLGRPRPAPRALRKRVTPRPRKATRRAVRAAIVPRAPSSPQNYCPTGDSGTATRLRHHRWRA